jgi:hypothetical protein
MLLQFTLRCNEECSHCLVDAGKNRDEFIDERTIERVISYLNRLGPIPVLITGGEVTLHPRWLEFSKKLVKETNSVFMVLSNGSWVEDEEIQNGVRELLDLKKVIGMQVTSFEKYYPNYQRMVRLQDKLKEVHSKIGLVLGEKSHCLTPLGRAAGMKPEGKQFSGCSNFLLVCRQVDTWYSAHWELAKAQKLCVPVIDTHGDIRIGETQHCTKIGDVDDSNHDLFNRALKLEPCGKCGLRSPFSRSDECSDLFQSLLQPFSARAQRKIEASKP